MGVEVIRMELYEVLSQRRKSIKMSFDDLSAASKIPVSTLKKILTGVTANPPFETVRAIAHAMGITTDDVSNATIKKTDPEFSPAAMDLARRYDSLSEPTQKLITMITLFESADIGVRNRIIDVLVDHHNERMQRESAFDRASAELLSAISDPEDD